jgi:hypothetical protein
VLTTSRRVARLPVLLLDAAEATSDTARQLPALQRVVTDRLGSLDRSVRHVLALLPTVAADIARLRETVEPQHERVIAIEHDVTSLPTIAADLERLRQTVEPQHEQVSAIEETIARVDARLAHLQSVLAALKGDVEDAAEHLPEPNAPGPLARARDTLVGRS